MNALEKHSLKLIGENVDSPDVFTDTAAGMAQIRGSLNDAIQEICMATGAYRRGYLLPLYADRQFYRMGWARDHFGWVMEAWDRGRKQRLVQTDLIQIAGEDPWWLQRTGSPEKYMQIGEDILAIYRKPSANGTVLELHCACIPRPYAADNEPVRLREAFERAAVYFAVGEFFASRGDAARAVEHHTKYMETANLMALHPDAGEKNYQMRPRGNKGT